MSLHFRHSDFHKLRNGNPPPTRTNVLSETVPSNPPSIQQSDNKTKQSESVNADLAALSNVIDSGGFDWDWDGSESVDTDDTQKRDW